MSARLFSIQVLGVAALGTFCWGISTGGLAVEPKEGRELFEREWLPLDSRSHGGDGLGPVFNDTSCVACHNQGGIGGGGASSKNVQIVTAFKQGVDFDAAQGGLIGSLFSAFFGNPPPAKKPAPPPEDREAKMKREKELLVKRHPGFATARSVVLHRFSTEPEYAPFRSQLIGLSELIGMGFPFVNRSEETLPGQSLPKLTRAEEHELGVLKAEGQFGGSLTLGGLGLNGQDGLVITLSERNAPALFGSGQLDLISDEVLVAAAQEKFADYPEVTGRVAKLKDGRLGRLGWKAQKARLSDFVLTACAVELGLHVPGEPQSGVPQKPDYKAPGFDLNEQECRALIDFVASLPQPITRRGANDAERSYLEEGSKLFDATGCAVCHRQKLGEVTGVYSDLLLHDMGTQLSDSGNYASFAPNATEEDELKQPLPTLITQGQKQKPVDESKLVGATRNEWRTPPLWGLRDSAPYLHDGRAATIDQAIALHGGEGAHAAAKFVKLTPAERLKLTLFLRSLAAPN